MGAPSPSTGNCAARQVASVLRDLAGRGDPDPIPARVVAKRDKRFAQLRELLPGISEKVLTAQLRQLEADGIVGRTIKRASPPQVTYSLTRAGRELIEPMSVLCKWGTRHLGIPPNLPRYPTT